MLRYIVERISDGRFVELELPVVVSSASRVLSGPGSFSGSVETDTGGFRFASGELLADQRKSFIHEEMDGVIRNSWLVSRVSFSDQWEIEGKGFSSYLDGVPYDGEFRGINVDMADVVRHLWAHAQRLANADIGVTVTGMTGVRRGTNSEVHYDAAKADYDNAKRLHTTATNLRKAKSAQIKKRAAPLDKQIKTLQDQAKPLRESYNSLIDARKPFMDAYKELTQQRQNRRDVYDAAVKAKESAASIAAKKAAVDNMAASIASAKAQVDARKPAIDAAKALVDAKNAQIKLKRAEKVVAVEDLQLEYEALKVDEAALKVPVDAAKVSLDAAKAQVDADGGAWKILWWDTPDCGSEVQAALDESGWEFVEWSGWNGDRTRILKEIRLQKRVGRQQKALKFIEGDNITEAVVLESDESEYANTVTAIGAGEGKAALRVTVGVSDGRVRTPFVLDAKHVTKKSVLESLARSELAVRSTPLRIAAVTVDAGHDLARRGTFSVGDSILVECDLSWLGRVQLWQRIEEVSWTGEDTCDIHFGV